VFKSKSVSVARSPFALLSALALLGVIVLAQQLYFSPRVRAASSTIVISEVDADTPAGGTDTANEWFELQNVSAGSITLTNWTITDNVTNDTIPTITIGPGGHVIVAATTAGFAAEHPGFTGTVLTIADGAIGNGLANGGDLLILRDSGGVAVDGLSWGTNTTVLNPSAGIDSASNTNQRNAAGADTDTAADWTRAPESPNGNTNFPPASTNPTGMGAAKPATLLAGDQTLITVTVTPGSNPTSTGLGVSGNLSSIEGSATQPLFDDGSNGDVIAADNVFSYSATVSATTTTGTKTIAFSITDAQSRSGSGNILLTVASAEHMLMGNPSNAVADESLMNNYLMLKPQYALSYNDSRGTPNWTSWHLDSTWQGSITRPSVDFEIDPDLPPDFHRVRHSDYTNTGFDRGHMCPSADRTSTDADNLATFLTTNIVPQAPDNNQGPWVRFEDYLRGFLPGSETYIISGGTGTGGTGSNGSANTIAGGFINVPAVTWKVALILPVGDNDLSRVDNNTRVIAVIVPNVQGIRSHQWQDYLTTVDHVEEISGYNFYSKVPTAIQDVIEARLDAENDTPPVTSNQTVTTSKNQSVTITLSATDFNVHNTFTYTIVEAPSHGSLSGSNGNLTYSPNTNYVGPDLFKFKANDGALDSNVSTVTIMVNDAGVLQFSAASYTVGENVDSATITVTRTGGSIGAASVNFTTANATATGSASCTAAVDYVSKSGTLSWADGEAGSKTFTVTICDDSVNEEDETISLALIGPTGSGVLGTLSNAVLTIVNDDAPVLLTEENTNHVVALDSVTLTRDPFSLINPHNFSSDQRRRISLFVWRLGLLPGDTASAVTVKAEDDQGTVYSLTVEYVGPVTDLSGVTQVVVKLPDVVLGAPRDLWVTVSLRGPASGRAFVKIAPP
jgi:endonuclease G, mitochondrial